MILVSATAAHGPPKTLCQEIPDAPPSVLRDGVVVRDEPVQNRSIAGDEMEKIRQAEAAAKLISAPAA